MRKVLLASVAAVALVGFSAGFASAAAKPNNPTITFTSQSPAEGATLSRGAVNFSFTYNRTPKGTKTLTCSLSGPTSSPAEDCLGPTPSGSGSQSLNDLYIDLANGDYTFTVLLTLTDGGTATATRHFSIAAPFPQFEELAPTFHAYVTNDEWAPFTQSSGHALGPIQPVGGIVLPPTQNPTSTSGCAAADFNGISVLGKIALIQRGGCNFGVKVLNAEAAGATGVVIFNEGNPGRTTLFLGSLFDANMNPIFPNIPVARTSFAVGADLYNQYHQSIQNHTETPVMRLDF